MTRERMIDLTWDTDPLRDEKNFEDFFEGIWLIVMKRMAFPEGVFDVTIGNKRLRTEDEWVDYFGYASDQICEGKSSDEQVFEFETVMVAYVKCSEEHKRRKKCGITAKVEMVAHIEVIKDPESGEEIRSATHNLVDYKEETEKKKVNTEKRKRQSKKENTVDRIEWLFGPLKQ